MLVYAIVPLLVTRKSHGAGLSSEMHLAVIRSSVVSTSPLDNGQRVISAQRGQQRGDESECEGGLAGPKGRRAEGRWTDAVNGSMGDLALEPKLAKRSPRRRRATMAMATSERRQQRSRGRMASRTETGGRRGTSERNIHRHCPLLDAPSAQNARLHRSAMRSRRDSARRSTPELKRCGKKPGARAQNSAPRV